MVPNLQTEPASCRYGARSGRPLRDGSQSPDRASVVPVRGMLWPAPPGWFPISRPSQRCASMLWPAPPGWFPISRPSQCRASMLWPVSRPSQRRAGTGHALAGPSGMVPNLQTEPASCRYGARSGDRPKLTKGERPARAAGSIFRVTSYALRVTLCTCSRIVRRNAAERTLRSS
mgnify:CR=1 FL=1